jgi:hypothetical protein
MQLPHDDLPSCAEAERNATSKLREVSLKPASCLSQGSDARHWQRLALLTRDQRHEDVKETSREW